MAGKAVLLGGLWCYARLMLHAARLAGSEILRRLHLPAALGCALLTPLLTRLRLGRLTRLLCLQILLAMLLRSGHPPLLRRVLPIKETRRGRRWSGCSP